VTFRLCPCQKKVDPAHRVWMKLVQEGGRRTEGVKPETATFASSESVAPPDGPDALESPFPGSPEDEPPDLTRPHDQL
jgi:hypothetical protein